MVNDILKDARQASKFACFIACWFINLRAMQGILHHTDRSRLAMIVLAAVWPPPARPISRSTAAATCPGPHAGQTPERRRGGRGRGRRGAARSASRPWSSPGTGYRVRPGDRLSTLARTLRRQRARARRGQPARGALRDLRRPGAAHSRRTRRGRARAGPGDPRRRATSCSAATRSPASPGASTCPMVAARRRQPDRCALPGLCRPEAAHARTRTTSRIEPRRGASRRSPRPPPGTPPPLSGQGFLWPVNGKVIGGFGPIDQGQRRDGIDIAAREGAPGAGGRGRPRRLRRRRHPRLRPPDPAAPRRGLHHHLRPQRRAAGRRRRAGRARPGDRPGRLDRRRERAASCTSSCARAARRSIRRPCWCASRPRSPAPSSRPTLPRAERGVERIRRQHHDSARTRQTLSPASSATSSEPSGRTATPQGRP